MTTIHTEFCIENFLDRFFATVCAEASYSPGEAKTHTHPGAGPSIKVINIFITSLSSYDWDKDRSELREFLGQELLNKLDSQVTVDEEWLLDRFDN